MSQSVKLVLDDGEYDLDLGRFMLSEAMALEDEWGVNTSTFAAAVTSGNPPPRVVGAMVWLVKVRAIAAAGGISFREAAKQVPVATFDTDLMALRIEDEGQGPENPTPGGTRTRTTRTTRATSVKPRTKRGSSAGPAPTKASSASS